MSLPELIEKYGSEDKCHQYLQELRWPDGVICPRCEGTTISRIQARRQFDCDGCRYQFSVRVGTVLQDSKLPLWKWFLAVYLMVVSKKGISANQLKGMVGVSYKTAWYLCHRIRSAMEVERPKLSGTVEVDETWIGGEQKGKGRGYTGNKALLLGAVERNGDVRIKIGQSRDGKELGDFIRENVTDDTPNVYTDELSAYKTIPDLKEEDTKHQTVNHSKNEWVRGDVHTNSVESAWSLLKRSVIGSYHQLSKKHLDAYVDEFEFRFNNRKNPYLFRDTVLALIDADMLPYKDLVSD